MPFAGHFNELGWSKLETLQPKTYLCGFCGAGVASEKGYPVHVDGYPEMRYGGIYICPSCKGPTYFRPNDNIQFPGPAFGNDVEHVPDDLDALYSEARDCTANSSYTAAVLVCRKILMNIAVNQGAPTGRKFIDYVNYLSSQGFVPPNGKHWVDHIRKKGNEANHEIALMDQQDAHELLIFIEMLLKFIYEFPNLVPQPTNGVQTAAPATL